jgi:hypothetical protein
MVQEEPGPHRKSWNHGQSIRARELGGDAAKARRKGESTTFFLSLVLQ